MKLEELADELKIKDTYLRNQWARIVKKYGEIGITLVKIGRGDKSEYGIKSYDDEVIRWEYKK